MGAPGHLAAKAPGLVVRQLGDVGSRQIVPAHIGHGASLIAVVAVPGAQPPGFSRLFDPVVANR